MIHKIFESSAYFVSGDERENVIVISCPKYCLSYTPFIEGRKFTVLCTAMYPIKVTIV